MDEGLRAHGGGTGEPLLLLLHGLGATGDVWSAWSPLLEKHWPGRWLAPDLPGHGNSPPLPEYSFDALAEAVAPLVEPGRTVLLGHSLGGVVALALAARVPVTAVVGLGVKAVWTAGELARAQALAQRPVTWFGTREEAVARYLRVSGLAGLLAEDDPAALAGVHERDGQWRLALDPRAFGVGAPDLPALVARVRVPVTLARGEHDPMNSDEQLEQLGVPAVTVPGSGHNAHVEDPDSCVRLLMNFDS
ncbi:alpha/beta fold hydrolase [Actinoplanes sp. NPDC020271]|uniref:alpha/beta fold hydrolase n=1 Tax=Actinoplanes sp. NPDC020271 TaxID=3363896 RepID=UPI003788CA73